VTLIIGDNARGKTNLIEAIYLLSTGTSFRASRIEEMVQWEAEVGHVAGITSDDMILLVTVTRGIVQGKRVQKRLFKVNGVGRRRQDFVGYLPCVLFRPEDMDLLTGNPSLRRHFMDDVLVQTNSEYRRSLESYEKALRQRNKLLDMIREGMSPRTALAYWDHVLIKEGQVLTDGRSRLIEAINQAPALMGRLEVLYDKSLISVDRLQQYEQQELAVGYTLVGPHKDDLTVIDWEGGKERNLATYGSRGEQRMAVLWLKEAQLAYIEQQTHQRPLLLLDDILSELDEKHSEVVVRLALQQQTVVTTAHVSTEGLFPHPVQVIRL
jgi:DNA replication and repair protein RecF